MLGVPRPYPSFQSAADTGIKLGMVAHDLFVNGNRPDPRGRLQHRHNLGVENLCQWITAAPAAGLLLLGWQGRVGLDPITRGLTDTRLRGGNGNGMGLSERHEYPHLLVSDMTARHERSSLNGRSIPIRAGHDRQTRPSGAKRWGGISPVGLRPPYETPPQRSHPD